jgi:hypothetical protein
VFDFGLLSFKQLQLRVYEQPDGIYTRKFDLTILSPVFVTL